MTLVGNLFSSGLYQRRHYVSRVPEQEVSLTVRSQFISVILELTQCVLVNVILVGYMPVSGIA